MKRFYFLPIILVALAASASAQKSPYAGRWDLTVTPQTGNPFPQWMELTEKDGKLEGRFQPRGGAWRPLAAAKVDDGHLILTLAAATANGAATTWDFTAAGDTLTGVRERGETAGTRIAGVRAPELKRPMPAAWDAPVAIFNGKDLAGWEPIGNVQHSKPRRRHGQRCGHHLGLYRRRRHPDRRRKARRNRRNPDRRRARSRTEAPHAGRVGRPRRHLQWQGPCRLGAHRQRAEQQVGGARRRTGQRQPRGGGPAWARRRQHQNHPEMAGLQSALRSQLPGARQQRILSARPL